MKHKFIARIMHVVALSIMLGFLSVQANETAVTTNKTAKPAQKANRAEVQQNKNDGKFVQDFRAKPPDGLYLFKPFSSKNRATQINDSLSPLVIIDKGKLIDPFVQYYQIGGKKFQAIYLDGKAFNVYVWPEKFGEIRNMQFSKAASLHSCATRGFFPNISDIQGYGDYKGKPLLSVKPVITPKEFQVSKAASAFSVTEEDRTRIITAVRRDIVPEALKYLRQRHALTYEKHMGRDLWKFAGENKNKSSLVWFQAFDIDGNGNKGFICVYELVGKSTLASNSSITEDHSINILFVFKGTGKAEKVAYSDYMHFFKFGGVLDMNEDGVLEIILEDISLADEGGVGEGKQVKIFSFISTDWVPIYETAAIGCE